MYFDIICIAEICNPAQGSIIKCKVKAKNSLGVLAEGYYDNIPILEIIIPKISAGIQSEINIDTIAIDDEIKIEVCGKKFSLFDKHISIIGRAIKSKSEFIKNAIPDAADDEDNETTENPDEIEDIYNESDKEEEEEEEEEEIKKPKKGGADDETSSSVSVSDLEEEIIDEIDDIDDDEIDDVYDIDD